MSDALVRIERAGGVAILTLDRPKARNALSPELMLELADAIDACDSQREVGCVVIAGSDEVFAAGADIKAMSERSFQDALMADGRRLWARLAACQTPLVAAVSGYALGGGCELALACDMIVASETATFGQPEIRLGIIPGAGGTQRLTRALGKHRAMELVITGRGVGAEEAHAIGVVNQVVAKDEWLSKAIELAQVVARRPPIATRLAKQAVLAAEQTPLAAGLDYERRLFELALATEDRVEGMRAFLEKREPDFKGR